MYIAPNSTIYILKNVRIDNTYANTIHFNSSNEQALYFQGLQKYVLTDYSYLKKENAIRVELRTDNLYDCNYIMFQNSSFGSKWFYAFITNVEYVNNETSAIYYEIDVMQTWYFNYTVNPSFIEREHSASDDPGDNLVPDDLELGEYVADNFDGTGELGTYCIVIAATFDGTLEDVPGGYYSGIYSGLFYNIFFDADNANDFIEEATAQNKSDGIVAVFMTPVNFTPITHTTSPAEKNITKQKSLTSIGGYTPRNKKLLTYPYNFLYVTNLQGDGAEFPYEFFSTSDCQFGMVGDMSTNMQIILYPKNYKGVTANYNEKMVLDGFPQCTFNTDSFKAWMAMNGTSTSINLAASAGGGTLALMTGLTGGGAGVALGAAGIAHAASQVAQVYARSTLPPQARGKQANGAAVAAKIKDFAFMNMHVQEQFARIIDDYWDMYGYPSHRVKLPNISTRPHWNYVKTVNVSITGSIPTDDMAKIKSIYDNGVTFWRYGNEVGNYALDNRIASNTLNGGDTNG